MALQEGKGTIAMSPVGENERGFSLLELLVVLLLLGVSSLIVLPRIDRGFKEREMRQSALKLAAAARDLRSRAIYESTLQRLIFNPYENSYQALGGKKVLLSSGIKITGIEGGRPLGEGRRQFLFFPNGSILGRKIELSGGERSVYIIRLDPLLGRVQVIRGNE